MRSVSRGCLVLMLLLGATEAMACPWGGFHSDEVDLPLAEGAACTLPPDEMCRWSFAYRSAAAQETFDRIADHLSECLGAPRAEEAPVNHPDSYRLIQFETTDAVIFLSLKDKASLQRSFVFLRVGQGSD